MTIKKVVKVEEMVAGTIRLGWQISEKGLGIDHIQRELTRDELNKMFDRIEEILSSAFSQKVTIWIDGEEKPGVDVFLENMGDGEIEIDDGPANGILADLKAEP